MPCPFLPSSKSKHGSVFEVWEIPEIEQAKIIPKVYFHKFYLLKVHLEVIYRGEVLWKGSGDFWLGISMNDSKNSRFSKESLVSALIVLKPSGRLQHVL